MLEAMAPTHHHSVRQPAHDQGICTIVGPDTESGPDSSTDDDVARSMSTDFHARDHVIGGRCFERVNGRVIMAIFEHEWSDCAGDGGNFAAGKALVPMAGEELVGIACLVRPFAREHAFHGLHTEGGQGQ